MRTYKYVFFDVGRAKGIKVDTEYYFYLSTADLRRDPSVIMVSYPMDYAISFFNDIYIFCRWIVSKVPQVSFIVRFWYPFIFRPKVERDERVCFVIYGYYVKPDYLRYLRNQYPSCRIVKLHRDGYSKWRERNPEYSEKDMRELFDAQFSFDKGDSLKYGLIHFDEIASKVKGIKREGTNIHDVFFAGAAKDRLKLLLDIYDQLTDMGVDCFFYITNAGRSERVVRTGVVYGDRPMPYREMLYHEINSNVILEINQMDVDGYTSRFIDSIMYDKKLITNNKAIKDSGFYNADFMKVIERSEDISCEFVLNPKEPEYHYADQFSPVHLIDQIDEYLSEADGKEGQGVI